MDFFSHLLNFFREWVCESWHWFSFPNEPAKLEPSNKCLDCFSAEQQSRHLLDP